MSGHTSLSGMLLLMRVVKADVLHVCSAPPAATALYQHHLRLVVSQWEPIIHAHCKMATPAAGAQTTKVSIFKTSLYVYWLLQWQRHAWCWAAADHTWSGASTPSVLNWFTLVLQVYSWGQKFEQPKGVGQLRW